MYSYDALNRIVGAIDNTGHYNLGGFDAQGNLTNPITYDKNGNILNLQRQGHTEPTANVFGLMDRLAYQYDGGNKLLNVSDTGTTETGFRDKDVSGDDFTYDANGNMLTDGNKGITNIKYNHLNLPTEVQFNTGGLINYVYDASGGKLEKTASNGTYTEYAGNYIYEGGKLQFFNHTEGYVSVEDSSFKYVYRFTDHLGNNRLSYTDDNGDGSIDEDTEIVKETNYYPFGLSHRGYNSTVSSLGNAVAKRYMFGGKEYQEELNLNWYDITARNYDPAIGRWMNLDPLAEQMRRHSPYNYAFDNPIFFIDPDGMMPCPLGEDCNTPAISRTASSEKVQEKIAEFKKNASKIFDADLNIEGKTMLGGKIDLTLGPIGTEAEVAVGRAEGNIDLDDKTASVSFDGIKLSAKSKVRDVTVGSADIKLLSGSLEATMNDDGGVDTKSEGKLFDKKFSGPSVKTGDNPSLNTNISLDDLKIGGKMKLFGALKLKVDFSFGSLLKTTINAGEIAIEASKSYVDEKIEDFKRKMSSDN